MERNYRIVKDKDNTLMLCAVYYEDWKPIMYNDPAKLDYFWNKKSMHSTFNLMSQAFDRWILNIKDIWKN